jgi:large subunit ribosomal protein L27e
MNKKTIKRKSKVKPFVKAINYTHILPTRYVVDIDLKKAEEPTDDRKALKRAIRKTLEERYLDQASIAAKSERKSQGTAYFYKKLRF